MYFVNGARRHEILLGACLSISNISNDTSTVALTETTASSVVILRMTMTVLPIIGLLVGIFLFAKKYILTDAKIKEISAELQGRK